MLRAENAADCRNDWVCSLCRKPGHKRQECGQTILSPPSGTDRDNADTASTNTPLSGAISKTPEPKEEKKKKKKETTPAPGIQKITSFIASCRSQSEAAENNINTPTEQQRNSTYARSPRTPPEAMNDDVKRNKLEQLIEDNEESSDNTEDEQQEETNLECEKTDKTDVAESSDIPGKDQDGETE